MSILFVNPAGKRRKVVIRNVRYSKAKEAAEVAAMKKLIRSPRMKALRAQDRLENARLVKRLKRTPAAHAARRAAVASMKRAQAKAVVWAKSSAGVARRKRIEKAQAEILERQLAADRKNQKRNPKKTPRRAAKLVKKFTKGKNLMAKKIKVKKINIKRTRARKTSRKIARKHKRSHAKRYVTTAADMRARLAAARQVAILKAQAQAAYKPKKRRKKPLCTDRKSRKSRKAARVVKTARRSRRRSRGRKQVSLAAMRNRWAIKRRSELRRARSDYGRLGGQISWGKKHDRAGYLLPNPGRKRRRRRSKLRRNPSVASIKSALTAVLPTIGGFMVARVFTKRVAPLIPGLNMAGKFADTVVALVGLVAADFATNKVTQLSKYKTGIVAGFALNAVESAMRALLPESVKAKIGLSDYVQLNGAMYDRGAISDYVQLDGNSMGEYVEMPGDGSSGGGYIDVEQDLAGVRADLAGGVYEELGGLRSPVQTVRRIGGVPAMSYTGDVGMATEEDDASLYTGVFSPAY